jgi:thiol-disulfide isomerase/thioredoxin
MRNRLYAAVALALAAGTPRAEPPAETVTLTVTRYDGLTDAVRKLRGKVVVVDFWADFCAPCKREFPRLVALHRKHADAGLATVSVSLDANGDAERGRVLAFLKRQKATFANFLLDEPAGMWQHKLKVDGPPLVFVFNRKGDLVRRMSDGDVDYDAVARLVATLLTE